MRLVRGVEDDAERLGDFVKKLRVCVDSFVFGPVPSNDVVAAGCHKQAARRGVGAVDEDLIVDALRGTVVGDVDEPKRFESAIKLQRLTLCC